MSTTPFLKWAGSKRRLVPELLAHIPQKYGRYYEPFAGSAALFFALRPERAVLGDLNSDLIMTYKAVASDPAAVVRGLRRHAAAHTARHYYAVRDRWRRRASWTAARRACAFIYFNRTCFNGLWRVNRAGEFNVPLGRYENPTICEPTSLQAAHALLQTAELRIGDFRVTLADVERGDVVYLDPPYVPVSATANFTSYSAAGFGLDDHRALADTARQLVARGCHVMLSNADVPLVRRLYDGFRLVRVKCSRIINSNTRRRGEVNELLILGDSTRA